VNIRHLKRSADFAEVLEGGQRERGEKLVLHCLKAGDEGPLSVGLIISRKVVPSSVRRNYLRRVIYNFFSGRADSWQKGVNIVVRVVGQVSGPGKKSLAGEVRTELEKLITKTGMLK